MRSLIVCAAIVSGLLQWAVPTAKASDYPAQPIKLLVPAAAGGAADTIARMVGRKLEVLGKPVVVDNRPGAASIVGFTAGAKSPADGYTLILGFTGASPSIPASIPTLPTVRRVISSRSD